MKSVEEHASSVISRYDEFQSEAVANIVSDYRDKTNGRYLLVIPTGGGKTFTAVKAINALFAAGVLDPQEDQIVWGAHRRELIKQAKDTFEEFAEKNAGQDFSGRVIIDMMPKIAEYVKGNSQKVRIAVIDEAHHAATQNITYAPLFAYPNLGILGLTATPSRHDGEPLEFEKESFSIGFPDLVERQLILSPSIDTVQGGRFEEIYAKGVSGFTGLGELDCPERDKKIIGQLLSKTEEYEKVIVYAANKEHVRNLYKRMMNSELINCYESIDYILGGNEYSGNDGDRDAFIDRIKGYSRAIIINCDVLTEGYDDPTVNTVVMAAPIRSKLIYMQAIGRCIRVDKENPLKRAYVVEVVDHLPNIRYRINNRWLFSEISDALEPEVEDRSFSSAEEFNEKICQILNEYNVNADSLKIPVWNKSMRYSLLLFKSYIGNGKYRNLPIFIDSLNRSAVSNWFNFLSERFAGFHSKNVYFDAAMKMAHYQGIKGLEDPVDRQLIYESMGEAYKETLLPAPQENEVNHWITFVSFRFKHTELPCELRTFIDDMVNKQQMAELIGGRLFRQGDYLIKLPLPLEASIGMIVSADEFSVLKNLISELSKMREELGKKDHLPDVDSLLRSTVLPIPPKFLYTLPIIIREKIDYFYLLD